MLEDPCFQELMELDCDKYETPLSFKEYTAVRSLPPLRPAFRPLEPAVFKPAIPPSAPTSILVITTDLRANQGNPYLHIFQAIDPRIEPRISVMKTFKAEFALPGLAKRPTAVVIVDDALTKPWNTHVRDGVLKYVREGGTAVLAAPYVSHTDFPDVERFFAEAGLGWTFGDTRDALVVLNKAAVGDRIVRHLSGEYDFCASMLNNVDITAAWYHPYTGLDVAPSSSVGYEVLNLRECPIAFGQVGKGNLGYVGDKDGSQGSRDVVLAMCGFKG